LPHLLRDNRVPKSVHTCYDIVENARNILASSRGCKQTTTVVIIASRKKHSPSDASTRHESQLLETLTSPSLFLRWCGGELTLVFVADGSLSAYKASLTPTYGRNSTDPWALLPNKLLCHSSYSRKENHKKEEILMKKNLIFYQVFG
jgi:hypothetical protein